ncbi:unnamed protein product [Rotaria sp. Silwood2]|nr:unnamed protein product [Rotaria sp. Silwood2]
MSTCPDAIDRSTVLIGLSDIPPGRPWSDDCHRSSAPTEWQMFHDVNATEDWDDVLSRIPSSTSLLASQLLYEKQQKDVEHHIYNAEDVNQKTTTNIYTPVTVIKQAHVFKEHDNDGLIHPVETDEITKNLMKIRTLQLIGGAGRGTCCLLRTVPPVMGCSSNK